jgi:hypothetical protein
MARTSNQARATSGLSLVKARYIIESQEWSVQLVVDSAPAHTILANGFSAVATGDMATAERMAAYLASRAQASTGADAAANAHADHGAPQAAAAMPESNKGTWIMHRELAALIAEAKGQRDAGVALLREATKVEESMRPPNGAADPIKPSHELLGEMLLRAGKPAEAAAAFEACLLRMPNRARSLYGSATALAAAGQRERAQERWAALQSFWKGPALTPPTFAR